MAHGPRARVFNTLRGAGAQTACPCLLHAAPHRRAWCCGLSNHSAAAALLLLCLQVLLYRHEKTGAQLMNVINSDENKTFGVTFRWVGGQAGGQVGGCAGGRASSWPLDRGMMGRQAGRRRADMLPLHEPINAAGRCRTA